MAVPLVVEVGTVTRALLELARADVNDRDIAGRICQACLDGLDIDGASISLLTASVSRKTLWATDPIAELLEELQFTLNEGACMEAATSGNPVLVPDLHRGDEAAHWPIFAAAVAEQTHVTALFALPLQWGAVNLGVLDMYRIAPGCFSEQQRCDALASADVAALIMLDQRTDPGDDVDGGWLDPALGNRAEIHQATGMVIVQLGISATDALARLRPHAFVHQRLLIDVAHDVVARRLVFTSSMS